MARIQASLGRVQDFIRPPAQWIVADHCGRDLRRWIASAQLHPRMVFRKNPCPVTPAPASAHGSMEICYQQDAGG